MSRRLELAVERAQIVQFARAVRDADEMYETDSSQDLVASPTFTESLQHVIPDYQWRPSADRPWAGSAREATGLPSRKSTTTVLHAEQHFEYFEPIRPDDLLTAITTDGDTWHRVRRSGEPMEFREIITEFTNQRGELAVRSRVVEVAVSASEGSDK